MNIVAITGGRDRTPTLAELAQARAIFEAADVVREGEARGTDKAVAAWLKAREISRVEPFPADWDAYKDRPGKNPAGAIRNGVMLDGEVAPQLELGAPVRLGPRAGRVSRLVAFEGGYGTKNCMAQAGRRGILVSVIDPVDEPRPWNRHHPLPKRADGSPVPSVYVGSNRSGGRGSPLGNPWPLELEPGERRIDAAPRNLTRYREWLWARIDPASSRRDPEVVGALERITAADYLVCSCWPAHCHAEVIVAAWRWSTEQPGARACSSTS